MGIGGRGTEEVKIISHTFQVPRVGSFTPVLDIRVIENRKCTMVP